MDYQKYRWFFTSSGILVVGGKSDSQNEQVIKEAKPNEVVLHTKSPGSPFCIIKGFDEENDDVKEAAIFCASFSQAWKKSKGKPIEVHTFTKQQVKKTKGMKTGTFGINGKVEKIKVIAQLYLTFQEGKLRAVPFETDIAMIVPGEMRKEQAALAISKKLEIPIDEVMSSLPADGIAIKWL